MKALRLILMISIAGCEASHRLMPPEPGPTCGTLDTDATLVGLSAEVIRLDADLVRLRELDRHLAICLDGSYDLWTIHDCGRKWRREEKGWGSDE